MNLAHMAVAREASRVSIFWAVLLIGFALVAIAAPLIGSSDSGRVFAWLLLLTGVTHLLYARHSPGIGSAVWKFLIAAVFFCVAIVVRRPIVDAGNLTLLVSVLLIFEGVIDLTEYNVAGRGSRSAWVLLSGIGSFGIGWLIWNRWPSDALQAIETLVGLNMLVAAVVRLVLSLPLLDLARMSGRALEQ